jgi:hypothetical protein
MLAIKLFVQTSGYAYSSISIVFMGFKDLKKTIM